MKLTPELFTIFGSYLLAVVVIIWTINLQVKLKKLKKRYEVLINGNGVADLEHIIVDIQEALNRKDLRLNQHEDALRKLKDKISGNKGNMSVLRYKAFGDHGSDLSFSIALLDDKRDGVVLTGIYHSEANFIYAKPVTDGQSQYKLTPEEVSVIHQASQN
jgi:hypothetical protein